MKHTKTCLLVISAACVVAVCPDDCMAQAKGAPAAPAAVAAPGVPVIKLRKVSGLSRASWERTPEYQTSRSRGAQKQPAEWPQILATFDTENEWLDELTVRFHAITVKKGTDGKTLYSLFRVTVRYVDVQKGRSHLASAFLRPTAVKRYGDLLGVAVEFIHNDKTIAEDHDSVPTLAPQWWRNPEVVDNKSVAVRDGYLLKKSDSPFALINMDDHEVER